MLSSPLLSSAYFLTLDTVILKHPSYKAFQGMGDDFVLDNDRFYPGESTEFN